MTTALAAGLAVGAAGAASAAPIVYDFTPGASGLTNLGSSETYNAGAGTPTITASSGYAYFDFSSFSYKVAMSGVLVGNNRGSDERGLGVCLSSFSGNTCKSNPEIDGSNNELVQLNISALLAAGYTKLSVNADSATGGELLLTYGSTNSTGLGTLLASITSANGDVSISQNGNYLNFVSNGGSRDPNDVLLHSLTADKPVDTPEPVSVTILGVGLLGLGMTRRLRSKA